MSQKFKLSLNTNNFKKKVSKQRINLAYLGGIKGKEHWGSKDKNIQPMVTLAISEN